MDKVFKCPLCASINNSKRFNDYPGSFLNCYELIQCLECALIFASPLPSNKELNEYYASGLYYDKVANPFEQNILNFSLRLAKSRLKLITSYINLNKELKVLDIGAGNGQFGKALEEMKCNFIYDAVEPDLEVANQYTDNVVNHFSDISEVNESTYDLAVMNQVLEHVSDPVNFMITVSKLVKPGGYLYIDVPFQDYLFKPSVEPHILFWNPESLKTLSDKVGLKVLFCDTAGMPHRIANFFFNHHSFVQKITNPWIYKRKINSLISKIGFPKPFDMFQQFQSDHYGGNRQWLRCIAQKTT